MTLQENLNRCAGLIRRLFSSLLELPQRLDVLEGKLNSLTQGKLQGMDDRYKDLSQVVEGLKEDVESLEKRAQGEWKRVFVSTLVIVSLSALFSYLLSYPQVELLRANNDILIKRLAAEKERLAAEKESLAAEKEKYEKQLVERLTSSILECEVPFSKRPCQPRAHARIRKNNLAEYISIERERQRTPDLSGVYLRDIDLTGLDFANVKLERADFSGQNLNDYKFNATSLSGAYFDGETLLERSTFQCADCSKTIFEDAELSEAKFLESALLRSANFDRANMIRAVFQERADLSFSTGRATDLAHATLESADLRRVCFVGAILSNAGLQSADLRGGNFERADFQDAVLKIVALAGARLHGANFSGAVGLNKAMLESACGDSETRLPEGVEMPKNWNTVVCQGPFLDDPCGQ